MPGPRTQERRSGPGGAGPPSTIFHVGSNDFNRLVILTESGREREAARLGWAEPERERERWMCFTRARQRGPIPFKAIALSF